MSTLYYYISGSLFHSRERCENVKETPPHQNLQADGVQSRQTLCAVLPCIYYTIIDKKSKGNTKQNLCVRCIVRFFGRLHKKFRRQIVCLARNFVGYAQADPLLTYSIALGMVMQIGSVPHL